MKPIEYQNQRILLTSQIAKYYGTDQETIRKNYSNNKSKYILGKHYYLLKGDELKEFKNYVNILGVVDPRTPHLILWTEHGALLHAKSLGTDEAWATYEKLVDTYFKVKEVDQFVIPTTLSDALRLAADLSEEKEKLACEVKEMKPKAEFADAVSASNDSIMIGDLAKLLRQNGYNTGRNKLFEELRDKGYLQRRIGEERNRPTQRSIENGWLVIKETVRTDTVTGEERINVVTKVTPKGQQYFIRLFLQPEQKIALVH